MSRVQKKRAKSSYFARQRTWGERIFDVVNLILILFMIVVTLYPLLYTVLASFSDPKALLTHEGALITPLKPYTLQGYQMVLANPNIKTGFINTVFLVLFGTLLGLTMTVLGAYVLSRKRFKPRNLIMKLIMFTMFFNGGVIPTFFVVRDVGLNGTFWAMIIPSAMSTYNLLVLRTFFLSIPDGIEESAMLDGATNMQILLLVMLPLSLPALAVITLYYAVDYWNAWYPALLYIRDRELYPLQMFLRELLILNEQAESQNARQQVTEAYTRELVKYCTVVVSTVPILIVYPFLQKYFVKGVMIGAIKG